MFKFIEVSCPNCMNFSCIKNNDCIGVFDSGVGGINVLKKCVAAFPSENFYYFCDSANAPYGDKSNVHIIQMIEDVIEKQFIPNNIKALIIACNTVTNAAIDYLNDKYTFPIIGIEPDIETALDSVAGNVLVMATKFTIGSNRLSSRLNSLDSNRAILVGCTGLVELSESNDERGLENYLYKLISEHSDIDAIVLGCTHYIPLKDTLIKLLGKSVLFFDGCNIVIDKLTLALNSCNLINESFCGGRIILNSSSGEEYNKKLKMLIER